jgi:hypothetical protein
MRNTLDDDFNKLTTKRRGRIGEYIVAADAMRQGLDVFLPAVDDNQIDMIAFKNNTYYRIQVKTCNTMKTKTSIEVKMTKHINANIDFVAIYFVPMGKIAYYPYKGQDRVTLALYTAKNNQEVEREWFYTYQEFPR